MTKNQQKIFDTAERIAYPLGTKARKYSYKKGKATKEFAKELQKRYPRRKSWSRAPRLGASCDVGVGTAVRCVLKTYPRGLNEQKRWKSRKVHIYTGKHISPYRLIKKHVKHHKDSAIIIQYNRYGGGHHTLLYAGGRLYESGFEKSYFHRRTVGKIRIKRPFVRIEIVK